MPNTQTVKTVSPSLISLGDFIGSGRYFGACPDCRAQHMSSADRGRPHPAAPHMFQCAKCATVRS